MSPQWMARSTWTDVERPVKKLVQLVSPSGFAVHWPGPNQKDPPIGDPGPAAIGRILEAERQFHVETRGWSDIAYQLAVDQAGRVWDCRGIAWQSAANGDHTVNARWGAITLLLGPHEQPSPAMIEAVQWARTVLWLPRYPHAARVVGHKDLHQTDCPGPQAYALVTTGRFTQPWHLEDTMPTAQEIAAAVWASPCGGDMEADKKTRTTRGMVIQRLNHLVVLPNLQAQVHQMAQDLADIKALLQPPQPPAEPAAVVSPAEG
jgi:hypothetical protein